MAKSSSIPIFDGHNDTLLQMVVESPRPAEAFFTGLDGHLDFPRAKTGGFAGGFFAMFVPNPDWEMELQWRETGPDGPNEAKGWDCPLPGRVGQSRALNTVMAMMAKAFRMEAISEGNFKVIRTVKQMTSALDKGVMAAVLHMEGCEALRKDLDGLGVLYEAGLRSLGPVWSRPNAFGHGVPFNFPDPPDIGPGLTPAGKELVRLCNQLGIVVDISHLNEKGFWDVAAISNAPLVATHSGVHSLCRSARNLTDDQLKAIRDSGGLVGINFARVALRKDGLEDRHTSLVEIVRHAEYVAELIGVDHVAFGSDFDGTEVPHDLKDVAGLPKLIETLKKGGFKKKNLAKIAHGNWERILKATWKK